MIFTGLTLCNYVPLSQEMLVLSCSVLVASPDCTYEYSVLRGAARPPPPYPSQTGNSGGDPVSHRPGISARIKWLRITVGFGSGQSQNLGLVWLGWVRYGVWSGSVNLVLPVPALVDRGPRGQFLRSR